MLDRSDRSMSALPLEVRRAVVGDAEAILRLCRLSFHRSAQWHAPKWLALRWWRTVIAHPSCESWVWDDGHGVAGMILLVTDESGWHTIRRRWCAHPVVQGLMMVTQPQLLVGKIKRRWRLFRLRRAAGRSDARQGRGAGGRLWGENLAVDPTVRGRGIGSALFQTALLRAVHHGKERFEFVVETTNHNAQRLYRKLGAQEVGASASGVLYSVPVSMATIESPNRNECGQVGARL